MGTVMKKGGKQKKLNVEYYVGLYNYETGQWYRYGSQMKKHGPWVDYPSPCFIISSTEFSKFSELSESLLSNIDYIISHKNTGYIIEDVWVVPYTVSVTKKYVKKENVLDIHWHLAEKADSLRKKSWMARNGKKGDKQKILKKEYYLGFYNCETDQWYYRYIFSSKDDYWLDYPSPCFVVAYNEFSEFSKFLISKIDYMARRLEDKGYSIEQVWAVPYTISYAKTYSRKNICWHLAEKVKYSTENNG